MTTSLMWSLGAIFCFSLLGSLLLTPVYRRAAGRIGLLDRPDGRRKHQIRAIPLAGGIAVFNSLIFALLLFVALDFLPAADYLIDGRILSLIFGAGIIGVVGLLDDCQGLRGRHKILGQLVAVTVIIAPGHITLEQLDLFGYRLQLGQYGIFVVYLWMLGVINAINLIDGMDGLLGVIGTTTALTLAIIAGLGNQVYVAVTATCLAGALLGFLWYNKPPASIYMGDCGSMIVGLILGALSLQGSLKSPTALTLIVPASLLLLPIFDTTAAIARRKLTGRSIYTTDRGHLHHCLLRRGLTKGMALILIVALSLLTSLGAIATWVYQNDSFALFASVTVISILIASRLFGYAEFMLIQEWLRSKVASLRHGHRADRSHEMEVHLQGSTDWKELWDELTSAAFQFNLRVICLDVNAPAMHEGYHARWDRFGTKLSGEFSQEWRAELPLTLNGQIIGRVIAIGVCDQEPIWMKLVRLGEIIRNAEAQALRLTSSENPTPFERSETIGSVSKNPVMAG